MTTQQADRAIESAVDAEKAVLGVVMVHGAAAFDVVADILSPDMWFRTQHAIIWRVMQRLTAAKTPIDVVTVATALTSGESAEVTLDYLGSLLDGGRITQNVSAYAERVREAAQRRELATISRQITEQASAGETNVAELIEGAEAQLFALRQPAARSEILTPLRRSSDLMAALDERIASKGAIKRPTRLQKLDALTRGFKPGQLWVIGARPGMGKSALAMTIAVNATPAGGDVAGFVSLEMSAEELGMRELALRGDIPFWRLDAGLIRPDDPRLRQANDALVDGGLHLIDLPGATVAAIRRAARRLRSQHGERFNVLVVDYLQLVKLEAGQFYGNRAVEVGLVSGGLKELARELGITVLALSQLKRASEEHKNKRPSLSDFRESGNIEQDADVALLLHREGYYDLNADQTLALLDLAKQRNGPTAPIDLRWHPEEMRFTDYEGSSIAR